MCHESNILYTLTTYCQNLIEYKVRQFYTPLLSDLVFLHEFQVSEGLQGVFVTHNWGISHLTKRAPSYWPS
jgi:hypothetical protein